MRRVTVANAPYLVGVVWRGIKGLLPKAATAELLSTAQIADGGLRARIDADQIPQEYGGTSRFALGEHTFELGLTTLAEGGEEERSADSASKTVGAAALPSRTLL